MSMISELKRRNVFRVSAAYVVVGWLLLQVSDVVLDFVEAPVWVGKLIIALLSIGFVLALVLSWVFESTPEGIRVDRGGSSVDVHRARRLDIVTIVAAVGVAAIFAWQQFRTPGPATTEESAVVDVAINDASIAVLPFADLSPTGDQEYFTDGISEEILNVLAAIDGLAVASRTSSFAFKDQSELGIPHIGAALKVRHVLEGSVRSAGSTIRVTAQLIDASTDKHLWSQNYERELTAENVFEIQDEIASAIVSELAKSFNLDELASSSVSVQADTKNLDAYQLFLRGRQRFRVRSVGNIPGTIEIFQQAVELDPEFARAWAGLAAVAAVAPSWGHQGEGESNYVLAERAARQAIELDDTLALPYAVLGNLAQQNIPSDYVYSLDMYAKALKRDPKDATTRLWLGIDLLTLGYFDAAIEEMTRCQEIDPGYENCIVWEGLAQLFAGDYDRAITSFERQAGHNAASQAQPFALAMAANSDRLSALLSLAWMAEAFDVPLEPELVYQSMRDPDFDTEQAFADYKDERMALTGEIPDLSQPGSIVPLVFGLYEEMVPEPNSMFWWHPDLHEFRASPHRKRLIREMGIYTYWRERGFPPQCRPVGDDNFECD